MVDNAFGSHMYKCSVDCVVMQHCTCLTLSDTRQRVVKYAYRNYQKWQQKYRNGHIMNVYFRLARMH